MDGFFETTSMVSEDMRFGTWNVSLCRLDICMVLIVEEMK
jgi:hypothetical protein